MNKPATFIEPERSYPARFSADEFIDMLECGAFSGMKVELFEGELQRVNPAMTEHSRLQGNVFFILRSLFGDEGERRVFVESGIVIDGRSVLGPDVVVARAAVAERRMLSPAETLLVVEVADETLGRDLGEKMPVYAAVGIPTCWVVDARARVIHVASQPSERAYAVRELVRFGEPLAVPGSNQTIVIE